VRRAVCARHRIPQPTALPRRRKRAGVRDGEPDLVAFSSRGSRASSRRRGRSSPPRVDQRCGPVGDRGVLAALAGGPTFSRRAGCLPIRSRRRAGPHRGRRLRRCRSNSPRRAWTPWAERDQARSRGRALHQDSEGGWRWSEMPHRDDGYGSRAATRSRFGARLAHARVSHKGSWRQAPPTRHVSHRRSRRDGGPDLRR
jgi:hypothetical protein